MRRSSSSEVLKSPEGYIARLQERAEATPGAVDATVPVSLLFEAAGVLNESFNETKSLRAALRGSSAPAAADPSSLMKPSAWAHREQKYRGDLRSLQDTVRALEAQVASSAGAAARVPGLEAQVAELKAANRVAESQLSEYKSAERLAEQEAASAQIATLQLELEAAATRAKGLEAKVSELKEAAAAAQQQQQQQQQSVGAEVEGIEAASRTAELAAQAARVPELETALADYCSALAAAEQRSTEMEARVATQTAQGEQASQGTQAGAVAADAMQTATQTAQGEQASQGTQAGAVAVDATQTATQTAQGEQASQGTQAGAVAADAMQTATQTAQKELASQGTQNRGTTEDGNDPGGSKEEASLEGPENPFLDPNNTIRHPTIEEREAGSAPHKAKEGPTEELAEILLEREQVKWQVASLQQDLNIFQRTIQNLKFTVEEADIEKQTLGAQNLELAERLAQLSQFVTYKAQSTKNATVDFGTWLSRQPNPPPQ